MKQHTRKGERGLRDIVADIEAARAAGTGASSPQTSAAMSVALRHVSIQVRVFGPKIGVAKGMLVRKPNITKIQLVPSMIKVGPSNVASEGDDWVCVVVKQVHPTSGNIVVSKALAARPQQSAALKMRLSLCSGAPFVAAPSL